jgi:hypothetical protein
MKTKRAPARERVRTAAGDRVTDQRLSARRACGADITCRLLGQGSPDCWAVRVQNLSAGGISLLLDRVVPTGKVVTVEIHNLARSFSCQRQIRVIYTLQIPGGGLMMGGAFCPALTNHEFADLGG